MSKPRIPKGDPYVFRRLAAISTQLNLRSQRVVVSDRVDALTVVDQDGKHLFWTGAWTDSWVICFPGPLRYKIIDTSNIEQVFRQILKDDRSTLESFAAKITQLEWANMLFEYERSYFSQFGWHRLADIDAQATWDRFIKVFVEGKIVGLPWTKWGIDYVLKLPEPTQLRFAEDLQTKVLTAMPRTGTKDWFALDFNHPCYSFRPDEIDRNANDWPVPLFPVVDPGYLISSEFDCGVIADLDLSITVFGKGMLDVIESEPPEILTAATVKAAAPN